MLLTPHNEVSEGRITGSSEPVFSLSSPKDGLGLGDILTVPLRRQVNKLQG